MPELPEVETMRSGLESLLGRTPVIREVKLLRPDIRFPIPKELPKTLKDQPIVAVRRRAKYLLLDTPGASLLSHLGMTGSWRLVTSLDEVSRANHDHCAIAFADGRYLVYRDPRRFGVLDLVRHGEELTHPRLKGLGVEPLDEVSFTAEFLFAISRKRKVASKVFIMDQRIVVGIGNIYASEALYRARVRPTKPAGRLTKDECQRIVEASQVILREAIRQGGSSIRDYRQASGESGGFQNSHLVYERGGEPCRSCKHPIKSKVLGGRSTYWCVKCQL